MLFETKQHLGDCGLTREAASFRPPANNKKLFQEESPCNLIVSEPKPPRTIAPWKP